MAEIVPKLLRNIRRFASARLATVFVATYLVGSIGCQLSEEKVVKRTKSIREGATGTPTCTVALTDDSNGTTSPSSGDDVNLTAGGQNSDCLNPTKHFAPKDDGKSSIKLASVNLDIGIARMAVGMRVPVTVSGTDENGDVIDVSTKAIVKSEPQGLVELRVNPDGVREIVAIKPGTTKLTATVGDLSSALDLNVSSAEVSAITISPMSLAKLFVGQVVRSKAIATLNDSTFLDVSGVAVWRSTNTNTASIVHDGPNTKVVAKGAGQTSLEVSFAGKTGRLIVDVADPEVDELQFQAQGVTIEVDEVTKNNILDLGTGMTVQVNAYVKFKGGGAAVIEDGLTWSSSNTEVATVSSSGRIKTADAGQAELELSYKGKRIQLILRVNVATLNTLFVTPKSVAGPLNIPTTIRLFAYYTVAANMSHSFNIEITPEVTWSNNNPTLVKVDKRTDGTDIIVLQSLANKDISLEAAYKDKKATIKVTSVDSALSSIEIESTKPVAAVGESIQLKAVGTYQNDHRHDLTRSVQWLSSDTTVLGIDNGVLIGNLVGLKTGAAKITAVMEPISGTTNFGIVDVTSVLKVSPVTSTLQVGGTVTLSALYVASPQVSIPMSPVSWTSTAPETARVDTEGKITAVAAGTATINAESFGVNGAAAITVSTSQLPQLTTPVISPAAPGASGSRLVTITQPQQGAIYYTTNGTEPTTASEVYSTPFEVTSTKTVKAFATKAEMADSGVATTVVTVDAPAVVAPVISPAGGSFGEARSVTLSSATSGAAIYYSKTGTPSASSTLYANAISIDQNTTLQAIAIKNGVSSTVASANFDFAPSAPTTNVPAGDYPTAQTITLSTSTPGATIYYTINGLDPITYGVPLSGTINVDKSMTIKAVAKKTTWSNSAVTVLNYTVGGTLAPPTFTPGQDTYASAQNVTILSASPGTSIYYTVDGSTPTVTANKLYLAPVAVSENTTIKAIAAMTGSANSAVSTAIYNINAARPTASLPSDTYTNAQTVTLTTATAGGVIKYSLDGSDPAIGQAYSDPIPINQTKTLKAVTTKAGMLNSSVLSVTYTINGTVTPPSFSLAGNGYVGTQTLTITSITENSTVRYTTDGSTPTATNGTVYQSQSPIVIDRDLTIKAVALVDGWSPSSVVSATYNIKPATPVADTQAGTFASAKTVTLTATNGAMIKYSLDGSSPGAQLQSHSSPVAVTINSTSLLKAVATKSGLTNSDEFSALYTINSAPTNITLSNGSVLESAAIGTTVGTINTVDANALDTFTYNWVANVADNNAFDITGSQQTGYRLVTKTLLNFETKPYYDIQISSTDQSNAVISKTIRVTVTDVNEAPTDIALSNSSVNEGQPVNTIIGTLSATDPDAGTIFSYSVVASGDYDSVDAIQNVATGAWTLQTKKVLAIVNNKTTLNITIQVNDQFRLLPYNKNFTITINPINHAPTSIALSATTFAENLASGSAIGNFSTFDPDANNTFTYALVPDPLGKTSDNALFTITNANGVWKLIGNGPYDFETKPNLTIVVSSTDQGGLSTTLPLSLALTNVNEPPTSVSLSATTVVEGAANTFIGTLSGTDPENNALTYTLNDNTNFKVLNGNQLYTLAPLSFSHGPYSLIVTASDSLTTSYFRTFTINATDVNDAPTNVLINNSTVAENASSATIGTLTAVDNDTNDTFTFAVINPGNGSTDYQYFVAETAADRKSGTLKTLQALDFETKANYTVRVQVTDAGGRTKWIDFPITVTNVNERPTDITLTSTQVSENLSVGTQVGLLNSVDPEGGPFTYTIDPASAADNNKFSIPVGTSQLLTAASFDFEQKASYSIVVQTRDSAGNVFAKSFTITIVNINEKPSSLSLSSNTFVEGNYTSSLTIGNITGSDPESGSVLSFLLISPTTLFYIVPSGTDPITYTLKALPGVTYTAGSTYAVTIQAADQSGLVNQFVVNITVTQKVLVSIVVQPSVIQNPQMVSGEVQQFNATGTYNNGQTAAVAATWRSSVTATATVNSTTGVVTAGGGSATPTIVSATATNSLGAQVVGTYSLTVGSICSNLWDARAGGAVPTNSCRYCYDPAINNTSYAVASASCACPVPAGAGNPLGLAAYSPTIYTCGSALVSAMTPRIGAGTTTYTASFLTNSPVNWSSRNPNIAGISNTSAIALSNGGIAQSATVTHSNEGATKITVTQPASGATATAIAVTPMTLMTPPTGFVQKGTSFLNGGITFSPANGRIDYGKGIVKQPVLGKYIVQGAYQPSSSSSAQTDFELFRVDTNGNLDATFGTGGTVIVKSTSYTSQIAVQPDDKILLLDSNANSFRVARLLAANGALDTAFGGAGFTGFDLPNAGGGLNAYAIAAQPSYNAAPMKILVSGIVNGSPLLVRFDQNGNLDTTFNSVGYATIPGLGSNATGRGEFIRLQTDGRILVGGTHTAGTGTNYFVARFNYDGTLDQTFGTPSGATRLGYTVVDVANVDRFGDITFRSDGKIIVAGSSGAVGGQDMNFVVFLLNTDGQLDTTFNAAGSRPGIFWQDFGGNGYDQALAVMSVSGNRIIVGGTICIPSLFAPCNQPAVASGNFKFATVRLNIDGTWDSTYSITGVNVPLFPEAGTQLGGTIAAFAPMGADGFMAVGYLSVNLLNVSTTKVALTKLGVDGT